MRYSIILEVALIFLQNLLVSAIGQVSCVDFVPSNSTTFPVVSQGRAARVLVSDDDWLGVQRTAADLVLDIERVTGIAPKLFNISHTSLESDLQTLGSQKDPIIIIGTLGKSSIVANVMNTTHIDVSNIEGQWEAYTSVVVSNPLPGVSSAYVIIGSDKRGSIYAVYDHSEQFGVSPWYWWADALITRHNELYISGSGCSHNSPTVKYRGIFLNDEQPALQNWAMEKFTNGTGSPIFNSPFNVNFYSKLFELILRLKGNYLWPAMWSSAFAVDDPLNQYTADLYGVVMGTSHQEPMMRSTPNEWSVFGVGPWNYTTNAQNVYNYWVAGTERAKPYESIFTIGMRGDGDLPLSTTTNIELLEQIVADQRTIFVDVFNTSDVTKIPQMWALYQEVQGYYEDGMRVPDDVTLLWTDDLFGNIRRFPLASERNRTGGAGVYYHYDLVGPPRSYKWITSTQISKVYEQMSIAVERDATAIWIVNVGDLKPYELSTEFFISYGYDSSIWTQNNLDSFVQQWAVREFGLDITKASIVADIIGNVTRWNSRRKPELLNGTTFSLINYREAETVLTNWELLSNASTAIYNEIQEDIKPAYFQLVHHPVLASATLGTMWILQGMNAMYASQARLGTNDLAEKVENLFNYDFQLENMYHSILNGKWDHMMDQTHVMYYYWSQPMTNSMPPVTKVQSSKRALAGPMRIIPEGTYGAWPGDNPNQCSQGYNCPPYTLTLDRYAPIQTKFIDIGSGGPDTFLVVVNANVTWLSFSISEGTVSPSQPELRTEVSVDWSKIPSGTSQNAVLTFNAVVQGDSHTTQSTQVFFTAQNNEAAASFKGFVEGDGAVSIEAAHATRNTSVSGVTWVELPGYGRTLSGVTPMPRNANNGANFSVGSGPSLEYDFYTFSPPPGGRTKVVAYVSPSLNANGQDRPLAFAIQIDSLAIQEQRFIPLSAPGVEPNGWDGLDGFVANNIVYVNTSFQGIQPGKHTLRIWMIEPAVVIQKLVIDTGNLRPSYLGPPESLLLS